MEIRLLLILVVPTITITAETSIIDTAPKLGANLDGNKKKLSTLAISKSTIYGVDIRNIRGVAPYWTS